jgi:crotonobetaine/carnitine-CoA ligase
LVFRSESSTRTEWTYGQFDAVVEQTAAVLHRAGVETGSSIHVVLRNCPAFVAVWLAAARLGAWVAPVDPVSTAADVASQVGRVRPAVAVCASARAQTYRLGAAGAVPTVIELAEDESDVTVGGALATSRCAPYRIEAAPSDRLALMFTSGTTSQPKGVVLTHANYAHVAATMAAAADLASRHRWYVTLPLFHANAQYYCVAPAIAVGASVALTATFTASGWIRHARELAVTHASLFAAPIRMILARTPDAETPLDLEHVWFAQNLGAQHYEQFAELVGTRPRQLYGMTETIAIVCADTSQPYTNDVIGSPIAGRQVAVIDTDTGSIVRPGQPGELIVRGRLGVDLFGGYLDERQTDNVTRTDGDGTWFHTGDLVSVDEAGVLRFVGRVDDVIKVSGENVSLAEVEAATAQAPGVLEAAVVARPDPIRDAVPVAYVVARDAANPPSADELMAWAEANLTPAARPREWHLIDELPRTSVGKVRRFKISP